MFAGTEMLLGSEIGSEMGAEMLLGRDDLLFGASLSK